MLFFHVPIEPENIPEIKSETKAFMTDYSQIAANCNSNRSNNEVALDNIPIPPAIFIFHSLTTLFFFFHEKPNTNESIGVIPSRIKTIQKKTVKIQISSKHNPNSNQKSNKKIRITRKQHKDIEA
jgi:hypothetical protein